MKYIREFLNEKFSDDDSDPIQNMGIGKIALLQQRLPEIPNIRLMSPNEILLRTLFVSYPNKRPNDLEACVELSNLAIEMGADQLFYSTKRIIFPNIPKIVKIKYSYLKVEKYLREIRTKYVTVWSSNKSAIKRGGDLAWFYSQYSPINDSFKRKINIIESDIEELKNIIEK